IVILWPFSLALALAAARMLPLSAFRGAPALVDEFKGPTAAFTAETTSEALQSSGRRYENGTPGLEVRRDAQLNLEPVWDEAHRFILRAIVAECDDTIRDYWSEQLFQGMPPAELELALTDILKLNPSVSRNSALR